MKEPWDQEPVARQVRCFGCGQTTWVTPEQPVPEGWIRVEPPFGFEPVYTTVTCLDEFADRI